MKYIAIILFTLQVSATELSPSILMFHEWDLNNCSSRVNKALSYSPSKLHFLLAAQFVATPKNNVHSFCYKNDQGVCEAISKSLIRRIQNKIQSCLQGLPRSVDISWTFHLNDSTPTALWRNFLKFDPLKKYQNFSYAEFLIYPTLKTLSVFNNNVTISLQGEMGASIFAYPEKYQILLSKLQRNYPKLKFGISLNYNKIDGAQFNRSKHENIQTLFESLHFIGLSAYAPIPKRLEPKHFKKYVTDFKTRLSKMGIQLKTNLPVHFTEVGLGGGNRKNDGNTPAKNVKQAASSPYSGIYRFNGHNNPWKRKKMTNFRRRYHQALALFLKTQKNEKFNPVKAAFIWSAGSWDIYNIYPGTSHFYDRDIISSLDHISK